MSLYPFGIEKTRLYAAFGQSILGLASLDDLVWTELTDDVRADPGIQVSRGKTDERAALIPGTMTVTLDNNRGDYDKDNIDSPYYGQLVPDVPIKLVTSPVSWDGEALAENGIFFGTSGKDWPVPREVEDDSWVTLHCSDPADRLGRHRMSNYLPEEAVWDRITRVLLLAGIAPDGWVLYGPEPETICRATKLNDHTAIDAIETAVTTEGKHRAFVGFDRSGRLAFSGRMFPFIEPFSTVQATFGSTAGAIPCEGIKPGSSGDKLFTQVRVTFLEANPTVINIKLGIATLAGGTTLTLATIFDAGEALTADLPTGSVLAFGTGKVVTTTAAVAAGGLLIPITAITQDLQAGSTATWASNVCIAASNAAQLLYGWRELQVSGVLTKSRIEAEALAQDMLYEYGTPRSQIAMIPFSSCLSEEVSEQVARRAVGELVTLEHRPRYASTAATWDLRAHCMQFDFRPGNCDAKWLTGLAARLRLFWTVDDTDPTASIAGATAETSTLYANF